MQDRGWAVENEKSGNWLHVVDGKHTWHGDWRERKVFTDHEEAKRWRSKFLDTKIVIVDTPSLRTKLERRIADLERVVQHHEAPQNQDTEDADPRNMYVRAGYLQSLATRLEGDDREMLQRASRSLLIAARHFDTQPKKGA